MKNLLLVGVSLVALGAAQAAHAGPVSAPMAPTWSGWYVGGNAGYSWGHATQSFGDPAFNDFEGPSGFAGHHQMNGAIGGGQFGYNWMAAPTMVIGFEADIQASAQKGSISYYGNDCEGTCTVFQSASIDWFGTARGRLGWLISPNLMPFVTGGFAYGGVKTSGSVNNLGETFSWSKSGVNTGYALGGGMEGLIPGYTKWSWKVEYLYINLGSLAGTGPDNSATFGYSTSFSDNIVRAGIDYHLP